LRNYIFSNIPSDSLFSFRKYVFLILFFLENFNISENNTINVELIHVLHHGQIILGTVSNEGV
jgi:hypothetical protein